MMNVKTVLLTLLAVMTFSTAWAQNDGSACEKAIYVDSTLVQKLEANTTYWFTANTEDLPLKVYFFADKATEITPEIYIDFTCTPGVYEDANLREIIDLAASMDIYFPFGTACEVTEIDGEIVYVMSYERDLIELLAILGIDYSIPVYVSFKSPVSGTIQVGNIKTTTLCTDIHQRVEVNDTLYLQANKEGKFYFPVYEWANKNMSFTWTGSTPIRAYLAPTCDIDTLNAEYTYEFTTVKDGYYTQLVSTSGIDNYIRDTKDGNMYIIFMAPENGKIYVTDYVDHGAVTINNCIKNLKSTAIDFPLVALDMVASIPPKSYRIEANKLRNKNIRLKWQTTENKLAVLYIANFCGFELKASDPDVVDTIHLVYNEEMQCMTADIPMERINSIADQHTDGWLFMQLYRQEAGSFSWDTYEIEQPDCDSKSLLLKSTDSIVMPANHYNTSYKLVADEWKKFANTITWRGTRKAYIFIADTCSFTLAPYNVHVGKYIELNPNQSVELSQKELATLAKNYADPDGNLYLRLRSDASGTLLTCQSKPQDVTVEFDVKACDSYTWHGTTYTESGTYQHLGQTTLGADSLEILHLTINTTKHSEETFSTCNSYTWNGQTYTASGDYTFNTTATNGCDSIVTLHLTINTTKRSEETISACDSYTWNGQTYTASGDYTFNTTATNGCDSIITLHLTINQSYSVEDKQSACDSYTWPLDGNTYTTSGDYVYNGTTISGCDSIVTLKLTINYSDTTEFTATTCEPYLWNGTEYVESGTYTYLTQTAQGCDSLMILHLTVQCDNSALDNVTINGRKSQLVIINNSLYIQVVDINGIRYYDLVGRPVTIK